MTNQDRRLAVFHAVTDALREEEKAWKALRQAHADAVDRFEWVCGVRAANEVAIRYLAFRQLLAETDAYVWPEFRVGRGQIDLWIGNQRPKSAKDAPGGLGVELKYVMSLKEAKTVREQAPRLCSDERIVSAGFVLWGHDIVDEDDDKHPGKLLGESAPGWSPWAQIDAEVFPARYGENSICSVWVFGCDRLVP